MSIRNPDILYPVYPDINGQPETPTENAPGNGADLVNRYNKLIDAIAPRIQFDFSSTESDLGITLDKYFFLMLPVPFATYLADPTAIAWEILEEEQKNNFDLSQLQEPVQFVGLNTVFTVGLVTGGGGYGQTGDPLDDSYLRALEVEGRASFVDLPTVTTPGDGYGSGGETWNNLVGVYPLEPNVKITLRPTDTKPDMNQII